AAAPGIRFVPSSPQGRLKTRPRALMLVRDVIQGAGERGRFVRDRLRTCAGTTVAFAVAFTAFGAPAWADPEPSITDRPPVDLQSGSGRPSPSSEPSGGRTAPKVADSDGLSGKVEVEPLGEPRSREYFAVLPDTVS